MVAPAFREHGKNLPVKSLLRLKPEAVILRVRADPEPRHDLAFSHPNRAMVISNPHHAH